RCAVARRSPPSFPTRRSSDLGVNVKADARALAVFPRLFLELGHAVQPADAGDAVQHPAEFSVGLDRALVEQHRLLRINARRQNRSEEHTSELQSRENLVCRLL